MKTKLSVRKILNRSPGAVFENCPQCESKNLFKFEGEVFCNCCTWDSIAIHAESRAGSNIPYGIGYGVQLSTLSYQEALKINAQSHEDLSA